MRSILEKALIALLNEEKDKADALFHDFILERSRQIHESLRQGEDFVLDESWEQELSIDEMFSEADLAEDDEVEAEEVVAEDEFASDEETETADAESEEGADEVAADAEEVPAEEKPIEDRMDELEAELQGLIAEFDAALNGGEFDGEEMGDEVAPEMGTDVPAELPVGDEVTVGGEEEEQFESLEEGIVDTLTPVSVDHAEGKTTGGDKQKVDTAPRVKNTPVDKRQAGEPVKIKSTEHNGYDREAAPKSGHLPKGRNTLSKGEQGQEGVKKEGDKSALLNKGGEDKAAQHSLFDKKRV